MKPRILITGFGPFPGQPVNPSATLVRSLRQIFARKQQMFDLKALVLKTEYAAAWKKLSAEMDRFKPDVVICFGVAAGETGFRLEQQARNHCDTTKPDAAGHVPASPTIHPDGAINHNATLPLNQIQSALTDARIDSRLSDDAGDYLCNHVFFNLMARATSEGTPVRAGFMHIPVPDQPSTLNRTKLLKGARLIIETSSPYVL